MKQLSYLFPNNTPANIVYRIANMLTWNMHDINVDLIYKEDEHRYNLTVKGEPTRISQAILFARFSMEVVTKE